MNLPTPIISFENSFPPFDNDTSRWLNQKESMLVYKGQESRILNYWTKKSEFKYSKITCKSVKLQVPFVLQIKNGNKLKMVTKSSETKITCCITK